MARELHRTVIRRENPVVVRRWRIAFVVVLAGALAVSFYAGSQHALRRLVPYDDSADELRTHLIALETQRVIDKQSLEELRKELAASRGSIDELEQELAFYRGVIAPEEQSAGVVVRKPLLRATEVPGVFAYGFVAQQGGQTSGSGKRLFQGELRVTVLGQQDGLPRQLSLEELDTTLTTSAIELSFRYFQRKLGQLSLPAGFEPESMTLEVAISKPEKHTVDYNYTWAALIENAAEDKLSEGD